MIQLISRNQRAVSPEAQPRYKLYLIARYKLYLTPKQLITNLSHDFPLDLCIGNKNEQTHLEYLEYFSI